MFGCIPDYQMINHSLINHCLFIIVCFLQLENVFSETFSGYIRILIIISCLNVYVSLFNFEIRFQTMTLLLIFPAQCLRFDDSNLIFFSSFLLLFCLQFQDILNVLT